MNAAARCALILIGIITFSAHSNDSPVFSVRTENLGSTVNQHAEMRKMRVFECVSVIDGPDCDVNFLFICGELFYVFGTEGSNGLNVKFNMLTWTQNYKLIAGSENIFEQRSGPKNYRGTTAFEWIIGDHSQADSAHVISWGLPSISYFNNCFHIRRAPIFERPVIRHKICSELFGRRIRSGLHQVQLILDSHQLIAGGLSAFSSGFRELAGISSPAFHFAQLSAEDQILKYSRAESEDRSYRDNDGCRGCPRRVTYKRGIHGGLALFFGIGLIIGALNFAYAGDDIGCKKRNFFVCCAVISFFSGAIILGHGLFYLVTANWLPYL